MKLLLDTQSLLWWVNDNPRLGSVPRNAIADRRNMVLVSTASFWEISIKHRIGKLEDSGAAVMEESLVNGFDILGMKPAHLAALEAFEALPGHKDPFDHMIMVQAMAEDAVLVTSDRTIRNYGIRCL